jgi:hypothetical protein
VKRALAAVAAILLLAAPASAREVMRLDAYSIDITYDARNRRVADKVYSICSSEVPRITAELGMQRTMPIEIRVEDDITPYRMRLGGRLPEWGVAFALMQERLIVVDVKRATNAWNSLDEVIPHELSHLFVAQRVPGVRFPIWFLEGLAQWQAREWSLIDSWQLMNSVWGNDAPRLWQLVDRYPVHEEQARTAYRLSYTAFTGLFDDGAHRLPDFLDAVNRYGNFDEAFDGYFGVDVNTFALQFHEDLERRYRSRLLFFQEGPLFSVLAVLFLIVGLRFYLHKRRRLRELDAYGDGGPAL